MKSILAAILVSASTNMVYLGEMKEREWYYCSEKEAALQVLDTARKSTLAESFKIWGLLMDGKKCFYGITELKPLEILDRGLPGDGMPAGFGEDLTVLRAVDKDGKEWFLINGNSVSSGKGT